MKLAQVAVDANLWSYDTSRYRDLTADIVGYVVAWERSGLELAATVDIASGRTIMWANSHPFARTGGSMWAITGTYGVSDSSMGAPAVDEVGATRAFEPRRKPGPDRRRRGDAHVASHGCAVTAERRPASYRIYRRMAPPLHHAARERTDDSRARRLKHGVFPPILGPEKW